MPTSHIKQLSAEVIGQIAAGEVVERPSAAIKELVENSMDAGASAITVEIRDGGLSMFRVVDNGSGIQPSDIRLAFTRHATSKISRAEDLTGIQTLGFRGEALASIAAVAKVTCTTRTRGAEYGISVQNNGGEMSALKEAACPEGTNFVIKDLFYNAPVRRKFLKKASVETGYVSDLMMRFILSHPDISFRYIADGKNVYFSAGDGKLESAVLSVYGLQTLEKLYKVSGNMSGVLLDGYVGVGELSRGNRAQQSFILNGRLIKSSLLTASLEEGCRQRVMIGRFPICILHLTMPFEATDVNVHPNKWEVRFQNETAVRQAVQELVQQALHAASPLSNAISLFEREPARPVSNIKTFDPPTAKPMIQQTDSAPITAQAPSFSSNASIFHDNVHEKNTEVENKYPIFHESKPFSSFSQRMTAHSVEDRLLPPVQFSPEAFTPNTFSSAPQQTSVENPKPASSSPVKKADNYPDTERTVRPPEQSAVTEPTAPEPAIEQTTAVQLEKELTSFDVRYIGVAFHTYVLFECNDRLFLCDQHAAHERILYERMLKACAGDAASQMLLSPVILHLTHREFEIFLDSRDALLAAGFDASDFGDQTVQLRSVPMVLGVARSEDCFRDALDDLAESGKINTQKRTERIIQMACKHAVKGGEQAPADGLKDLIRRMIEDNVTPTCPHGRPLVIEVTRRELEKRFGRIQN